MSQYQVIARRYRPQSFKDVLGQGPTVTTLKNAIKQGRLAHAYLFCGSRGTGKTTLARVFAKALNCLAPTQDGEPCNACATCKEISAGNSLDVLEIDGASHRGIDDIRQINETVGYASSNGKYKIYIIDEVHMLTKEAFNALLKTLEEPPAKVLFIFATTEPHKVLPTILSRCQRFNLNRIPIADITAKLRKIAADQSVTVDDEALYLLAQRADGGLRDAESLFDQIISFHDGAITAETVADILGIMPSEALFALDQAGKEGKLSAAFEIAHTIFSQGKDILQFVESLTDHFRTLLLIKLSGIDAPFLNLSEADKSRYLASAKIYTQEQCLTLLDYLVEAQNKIRYHASSKIALESILLHIMRSHKRLPIEFLVKRLSELENALGTPASAPAPAFAPAAPAPIPMPPPPKPIPLPPSSSISIDPTPSPADLGMVKKTAPKPAPVKNYPSEAFSKPEPVKEVLPSPPPPAAPPQGKPGRYDTLLQFAAVELEGTIQRKTHKT